MNIRLGVLISLAILCFGLSACGGGGGSNNNSNSSSDNDNNNTNNGDDFDFSAMFTNLADNIIIPNYETFKTLAENFSSAQGELSSYCAAIGNTDEATTRQAAQSAWRALMSRWQQAELHTLGPAASQANLLRNRIYAYDTNPLNTCRTDRAVIEAEDTGFDINSRTLGARGLDALEYLLFEENLDHTCEATGTSVDDITLTWNDRPDDQRKEARCNYAEIIAEEITETASEIHNDWIASGDNYRAIFIDPENQDLVLEAISDALFYIEKDTKDAKLGVPMGFNDNCDADACPDAVESPFSEHALQNLKANVEAFLSIYTGDTGLSFDDIIDDADMASVNTAFLANTQAITALIDDMIANGDSVSTQAQAILDSGDRSDCVNSSANPDTVQTVSACALHGLLKQLTDRLRTDFVTIVGVDLPDRVQGDTD